jgi:hypothetical protein
MIPLRSDLIRRKDRSSIGSHHGSLVRFAEVCASSPNGKAPIKVKVFDRGEDGKQHSLSPWLDPEEIQAWMEQQHGLPAGSLADQFEFLKKMLQEQTEPDSA